MGLKSRAKRFLNSIFKRYGHELVPSASLYHWQSNPLTEPAYKATPLPDGAGNYLRTDNARLKELQDRYASLHSEATLPLLWQEGHVRPEDLQYFRGDNAYVWQLRGPNMNEIAYILSTYYVKSIDHLGLLERLEEDDYFGIFSFTIDGRKVSRDLLDSIIEIYFLEKHLGISSRSNLNILDIGAGYGRLAHRMARAFPNIQNYFCTDAVAVSTFLSEFYLRFRNVEDRAKVVPLDEIESTLETHHVDLAVNIHSFSECSIPAIEWWLSLLRRNGVEYLMIVPNGMDHGGELLLTNDRQDLGRIIEKYGYKLIVREPKYGDPMFQQYAMSPTYYYLFQLPSPSAA
jgi:SAM-dependent methyltransferase